MSVLQDGFGLNALGGGGLGGGGGSLPWTDTERMLRSRLEFQVPPNPTGADHTPFFAEWR